MVVRSIRSSWSNTNAPSAVRRRSISTQRHPTAWALRNAASVFSGARPAAPRWPMTDGRPRSTAPVAIAPGTRRRGDDAARRGRLFRRFRGPRRLGPPGAQILAGLLIDLAHAELDLAALVKAQHLDLDAVAELDDVANLGHPVRRQFADMDKPVARSEKIDKGSEIDGLDDLAGIDR